ncbi:MAG TPA: dihydrolipoamide acetyltransferase family protein [Candidatus Dormibacteraeota bacterium]|nr:dihydrolipoamide acetyltransferase family protein [Candidatus Dormibacteraeota bacterium]
MSRALPMPKLGLTMTSGVVAKWHKAAGESVRKGEPLVEVSTDKIAFEYESPFEGVLERIEAPEGSELPPGATIAYFSGSGEGEAPAAAPVAAAASAVAAPPSAAVPVAAARTPVNGAAGARILASPVARRTARERGIDLRGVRGTGPRGRITLADLATAAGATRPAAATPGAEIPTGVRGAIYRHMTEIGALPIADVSTEVDATELAALIRRRKDVSWTAAAALAIARALSDHPTIAGGGGSDIGIAVDTDAGLMVPVVRDCAGRALRSITAEINRLAALAREGRLGLDDVAGGVISISNVGPARIPRVRPLPNAPQRVILGMGAALERPWARNGELVVAPVLQLVLSFDHRWIDGAPAARFLAQLAGYLASPTEML